MNDTKATPVRSHDLASQTPPQQRTSIHGHTVLSACITMSFTDMEVLAEVVNGAMRAGIPGNGNAEAVCREFLWTVESLT